MAKRKYLSPKERRAMYEAQHGRCHTCNAATALGNMIAEHWHPVALGNDQKPDCLLCVECALRKTNGSPATSYGSDSHAIAKDKRLRGITKTGPKKRIPSRPFQKRVAPYQWGSRKPLSTTQEEAS